MTEQTRIGREERMLAGLGLPNLLWGVHPMDDAVIMAASRVADAERNLKDTAETVRRTAERILERLDDLGRGPNPIGELQQDGPRLDAKGATLAAARDELQRLVTLRLQVLTAENAVETELKEVQYAEGYRSGYSAAIEGEQPSVDIR